MSRINSLILSLVLTSAITACSSLPAPTMYIGFGKPLPPPSGLVALCQESLFLCGSPAPAINAHAYAATASLTPLLAGLQQTQAHSFKPARPTARPSRSAMSLSAVLFRQIQKINRSVNAGITPRTDAEIYGQSEKWTLPLTYGLSNAGDCEDYALEKRVRLIASGIPETSLSLAVAQIRPGEFHTILIIRTDRGDLVLDNMTNAITGWDQKDYIWGAIQRPGKLLDWAQVRSGPGL